MSRTQSPSKAQQAYQQIRDLLDKGDLDAENPLTESRLSELLSMNRGPVRESLLRLEGEGRIRFRGRRRGRVIEFLEDQNKEELLKRYEMREFIVAGAARLAALNMTGHQISELKRLAEEAKQVKQTSPEHKRIVSTFWDYLLSHCGNELLYDAWDRYNLMPPAPRSSALERRVMQNIPEDKRHLGSLDSVVNAIASHDVDVAEDAVRQGVRAITEALRKTDWEHASGE